MGSKRVAVARGRPLGGRASDLGLRVFTSDQRRHSWALGKTRTYIQKKARGLEAGAYGPHILS